MAFQEILGRIRQEQASFPAAQRLVAAYVLENYYQIPFLSITTLARNIGVSDNTVVKFCNHLGYDKFTEFKKAFSECAHSELVMFNRLSESNRNTDEDGSFFAQTMEEDIEAIRSTLSDPVNRANLPKLLEMIEQAQHIYLTGGRASGVMASFFASALRYLDLKVHELTFHMGDYLDRAAMVGQQDLVIALSFSRYTTQVVDTLKDLHEAGVPIVLFTDTGLSPCYPYADLAFHCTISSGSYFLGYSGCLALINAICRAVGASRKDRTAEHIWKLENQLLERKVFQ